MSLRMSRVLSSLPPYPFADLETKAAQLRARGVRLIDLSVGDPDLQPPPDVLAVLSEAALDPANHRYSTSRGEPSLREAIARWYRVRFGVTVDSESEVCVLAGSKEGLTNLVRALADPGDKVLVPDPGYPAYANGAARVAGCKPTRMLLVRARGYLPDLGAYNSMRAKVMYLNYPNNPTGVVAPRSFLNEAVDFASDEGALLCYDNAYSEISFVGPQPSILEVPSAMGCAVEMHSISKTFAMPGDRVGFAVGNPDAIRALVKLKSQVDSGIPKYIQIAAARALSSYTSRSPPKQVSDTVETYKSRMAVAAAGFRDVGLACEPSEATFYLWVHLGGDARRIVDEALEAGVLLTPGSAFGESGSGFVRLALTRDAEKIAEAVRILGDVLRKVRTCQPRP